MPCWRNTPIAPKDRANPQQQTITKNDATDPLTPVLHDATAYLWTRSCDSTPKRQNHSTEPDWSHLSLSPPPRTPKTSYLPSAEFSPIRCSLFKGCQAKRPSASVQKNVSPQLVSAPPRPPPDLPHRRHTCKGGARAITLNLRKLPKTSLEPPNPFPNEVAHLPGFDALKGASRMKVTVNRLTRSASKLPGAHRNKPPNKSV